MDENHQVIPDPEDKIIYFEKNSYVRESSVPKMLQESADVYKQRQEVYGDCHKKFGEVMVVLFPTGICEYYKEVNPSVEHYSRVGILVQIISKLTRYAQNFDKGGHDDSLQDLVVYATMLRELDKEMNEVPF